MRVVGMVSPTVNHHYYYSNGNLNWEGRGAIKLAWAPKIYELAGWSWWESGALLALGNCKAIQGNQGDEPVIKCDLRFKLLLASAKPPGLVAPGMARRLRSEIDARFGCDLLASLQKSYAVGCFRHPGLAAEHCWRPMLPSSFAHALRCMHQGSRGPLWLTALWSRSMSLEHVAPDLRKQCKGRVDRQIGSAPLGYLPTPCTFPLNARHFPYKIPNFTPL